MKEGKQYFLATLLIFLTNHLVIGDEHTKDSTGHDQPDSLERQRAVLEVKWERCKEKISQENLLSKISHEGPSTNNTETESLGDDESYPPPPEGFPSNHCPTVFDELYCWPKSRPDTLVTIPCPSYVKGFSNTKNASRYCTAEGFWYIPSGRNESWTNYTDCKHIHDQEYYGQHHHLLSWTSDIRSVSRVGYSISLATLLVALSVLASFKRLRCPRNTMHMHLFLSFICRAICALNRDHQQFLLPKSTQIPTAQLWGCRLFTCVWQYFILANYSWILMEGLYLHNLVFLALFTDNSAITLYIALGWGVPLFLVSGWSLSRVVEENTYCWTTNENQGIFWAFVRGPISLSILISFILFIKITRELLLKLRFQASAENLGSTYRRWARSTLVLMPLFGVHYAALIGFTYFIGRHPTLEIIWLFADQFFASFQGFFVATLYCLLNGEVRNEVVKLYQFWRRGRANYAVASPGNSLYQFGNSKSFASRGSSPGVYINMPTRKDMSGLPYTISQNVYQQKRPTQDTTDDTLAPEDAYASIDLGLDIGKTGQESHLYKNKNDSKMNAKERSCSVDTYILEVSPTISRSKTPSLVSTKIPPPTIEIRQLDRPASSYGQYSSIGSDSLQAVDIRRERSVGCIFELGKNTSAQQTFASFKVDNSSPKRGGIEPMRIPPLGPNKKEESEKTQKTLSESHGENPASGLRLNPNGGPNVIESAF